MKKLKALYLAVPALAVAASANAAIDTAPVVAEFTAAGTSAGEIIIACMIFGGICMAGFALYRRLK